MKQRFKCKKMKLLKESEIVFEVVLRQKASLCLKSSLIHVFKRGKKKAIKERIDSHYLCCVLNVL